MFPLIHVRGISCQFSVFKTEQWIFRCRVLLIDFKPLKLNLEGILEMCRRHFGFCISFFGQQFSQPHRWSVPIERAGAHGTTLAHPSYGLQCCTVGENITFLAQRMIGQCSHLSSMTLGFNTALQWWVGFFSRCFLSGTLWAWKSDTENCLRCCAVCESITCLAQRMIGQCSHVSSRGWSSSSVSLVGCILVWCLVFHERELLRQHRWFSGRMLACHAGGPGSMSGRCSLESFG